MEDTHDVKLGLKYGLDDWSFFAVFDGHAGKCASAYAAWNLLDHILRDSEFELGVDNWPDTKEDGEKEEKPPNETLQNSPQEKSSPSQANQNKTSDEAPSKSEASSGELKTSNDNSMSDQDEHSKSSALQQPNPPCESSETKDIKRPTEVPKSKFASLPVLQQLDMVKNAIRSGFLSIDQKMRIASTDMSGCTAVCALISPTHLFIANCGDSRALLCDRGPKFATEDHKPFHPKEKKRIIDAGGTATQRINGTLAVSRALGDFEFKKDELRGPCEQLVSPEPEITIIERRPEDQFLILACDGIWDVMSNSDLCEYVRYKLMIEPSLENVCSSVIDVCLRKGSRDNMSIIIVVFENGPKVTQEMISRDKEIDRHLLDFANQVPEASAANFSEYFDYLRDEMPMCLELPPGAGIEAKYDLLHQNYVESYGGEEEPSAEE